MGFNLRQFGRHFGKLTNKQIIQVFRDIGTALCHLSQMGLAHMNLNMKHILCDGRDDLLLKLGSPTSVILLERCRSHKPRGTVTYVSPSMLNNFWVYVFNRSMGPKIHRIPPIRTPQYILKTKEIDYFLKVEDMWQFGILLLELLNPDFCLLNSNEWGFWNQCAEDMKEHRRMDTVITESIHRASNLHSTLPVRYGISLMDVLRRMLQVHPDDRMDFGNLWSFMD